MDHHIQMLILEPNHCVFRYLLPHDTVPQRQAQCLLQYSIDQAATEHVQIEASRHRPHFSLRECQKNCSHL